MSNHLLSSAPGFHTSNTRGNRSFSTQYSPLSFDEPQNPMVESKVIEMLRGNGIDLEDSAPFAGATDNSYFCNVGVVKINNIPFGVTTQEVKHFVSRLAPTPMLVAHKQGYPIHVVMEKPTGKTMECFIEFPSVMAAAECVERSESSFWKGAGNRANKLGSRTVTVEMSSQAELMTAIFPRARNVEWEEHTGKPNILPLDPNETWSHGFRGYFTLEEMVGVIKFAENPSRSPFVQKCQQRVYECMVSTLYKFPWAATHSYTLGARNMLLKGVIHQLEILRVKTGHPLGALPPNGHFSNAHDREVGLSQALMMDVFFAALNAPGFSLLQKVKICQAAGVIATGVALHDCAGCWPFQTLVPDPNAPNAVIKFWLELWDTGFCRAPAELVPRQILVHCRVAMNQIGFPIVELTPAGERLSFEEVMNIERALMELYTNWGKKVWLEERGLGENLRDGGMDAFEQQMQQLALTEQNVPHFPSRQPFGQESTTRMIRGLSGVSSTSRTAYGANEPVFGRLRAPSTSAFSGFANAKREFEAASPKQTFSAKLEESQLSPGLRAELRSRLNFNNVTSVAPARLSNRDLPSEKNDHKSFGTNPITHRAWGGTGGPSMLSGLRHDNLGFSAFDGQDSPPPVMFNKPSAVQASPLKTLKEPFPDFGPIGSGSPPYSSQASDKSKTAQSPSITSEDEQRFHAFGAGLGMGTSFVNRQSHVSPTRARLTAADLWADIGKNSTRQNSDWYAK